MVDGIILSPRRRASFVSAGRVAPCLNRQQLFTVTVIPAVLAQKTKRGAAGARTLEVHQPMTEIGQAHTRAWPSSQFRPRHFRRAAHPLILWLWTTANSCAKRSRRLYYPMDSRLAPSKLLQAKSF